MPKAAFYRTARLPGFALLASMVLGMHTSAAAQGATRVVTGFTNDLSGHPVPYATLWLNGLRRAVSDDSGRFRLQLPGDKRVTLDVRRIGFRPAELQLEPGPDTAVTIFLASVAQALPETRVAESRPLVGLELNGFYQRLADQEKWGSSAQFITPEEIAARNPTRATQLLDDRHGISLLRVGTCVSQTRCWIVLGAHDCDATIYLNGIRLNPAGAAVATGGLERNALKAVRGANFGGAHSIVFLDEIIHPTEIAGIEIYQRATNAPGRYQLLSGSCGIILVWTK